LLALAFALMLALAACGGDDDDTAADDTSEPTEQSEDTESDDTEADDTTDDTEEPSDDVGASGECAALVEALSSSDDITTSDDPAAAIEGLRDFADEIDAAVDDAPEEIRDDVEILADVYGEIADQLADVDVDSIDENDPQSIVEAFSALQPIFENFSSQEFVDAATNIGTFCSDAG
jgi:hypothetical protein